MKSAATLVPALLLAACASAPAPAPTAAAGATMYCWKDKLVASADRLACNWGSTVREACESAFVVDLPRAKVSGEPREGPRCANGQWLVEATTR